MSSHEEDGTVSSLDTLEWRPSRSIFKRYAVRRPGGLAAVLIIGFTAGIAYRLLMDPAGERDLANYLRSGLHGAGLGLAVWAVQAAFAASARSSFGAALRRLPVGGEIFIRSLAMTGHRRRLFAVCALRPTPRAALVHGRSVWHDLAEDRRHWVRHLARRRRDHRNRSADRSSDADQCRVGNLPSADP